MCHCGDHYCDMSPEARFWANQEHTRLLNSEEWKARFPNAVNRDMALVGFIRPQVIERFGQDAVDFRWDKEVITIRENAKTALIKDFDNELANLRKLKKESIIGTFLLLAVIAVILTMPYPSDESLKQLYGFSIVLSLVGIAFLWMCAAFSKYTVWIKRKNLKNAGIEV